MVEPAAGGVRAEAAHVRLDIERPARADVERGADAYYAGEPDVLRQAVGQRDVAYGAVALAEQVDGRGLAAVFAQPGADKAREGARVAADGVVLPGRVLVEEPRPARAGRIREDDVAAVEKPFGVVLEARLRRPFQLRIARELDEPRAEQAHVQQAAGRAGPAVVGEEHRARGVPRQADVGIAEHGGLGPAVAAVEDKVGEAQEIARVRAGKALLGFPFEGSESGHLSPAFRPLRRRRRSGLCPRGCCNSAG